MRYPGIDHITV